MAIEEPTNQNLVPESSVPSADIPIPGQPGGPSSEQKEGLFEGITPITTNISFDFEEFKDTIIVPGSGEPLGGLDPAQIRNIDVAAPIINSVPVNMYTSLPVGGDESANYDKSNPLLSNDYQFMNSTYDHIKSSSMSANPNASPGIRFGLKSSNFDRYYNHPKFQELGFHPYADNESYYNANSTWWDENARMRSQWSKIFTTGFMSTYDAIGDWIRGDGYLSPDTDGSEVFEDAMRIGMSNKKGVGRFFNNLGLQSGYTVGILSSIALEELALAGLEAATLGGATPIVASRTAYNIVRLGKGVDKMIDVTKASKSSWDLLRKFKNIDFVKDFWRAGGRFVGSALTPNTYKILKEFGSAQNVASTLSNWAKIAKTGGAFYRDMRAINLAIAESKLEAGMVRNQLISELYSEFQSDNDGATPLGDDLTEIFDTADEAAFTTTMLNAPIIYFSNALVFDGALRGFRGTGKLLNETMDNIGSKVLRNKKLTKSPFEAAGKTRVRRFIQKGFNGNLKTFAGALLQYTNVNLAEGFQELFQEGVAVGASDYYKNLYNDPAAGGLDAQLASTYAGIKSQWSGQGFEVFMSGFLMGGLVQGPQKWVFQGGPQLYQRITDPKGFKEYQQKRDEYVENAVSELNKVYNDPGKYFDEEKIAALSQKILNENMFSATYAGDALSFYDSKDASIFLGIHSVLGSGKMYEFRSQIKDYLQLDDEGLAEAFPNATKEEVASGKTRERLEKMITRMDHLEKSYKELNDKIVNPFDASKYKIGTKDYDEESISQAAFNHAKMLALYTRNTFERAVERTNQIYTELASDPIISKIAANDINVLSNTKDLISEIRLLKTELELSKPQVDEEGKLVPLSPEEQAISNEKEKRLKLLQDFFNTLTHPNYIEKREKFLEAAKDETEEQAIQRKTSEDVIPIKIEELRQSILSTVSDEQFENEAIAELLGKGNPFGIFDVDNSEKLKDVLIPYLQHIAETQDDFVIHDKLEELVLKLIDAKVLNGRAEDYNKAIQVIMTPENLVSISEKIAIKFKKLFRDNKNELEERLLKYVDKVEQNEFLNQLANYQIFPDADQAEVFLKGGKIPALYYIPDGILTPEINLDLFAKKEEIVEAYMKISEKEVLEDEEEDVDIEDVEVEEEDKFGYEENFEVVEEKEDDTETIDIEKVEKESQITLGKEFLAEKYKEYRTNVISRKKKSTLLSYSAWLRDKKSYQARKIGKHIDVLAQEVFGPAVLKGEKLDFNEWLRKNEDSEEVQNRLKLAGLTVEDILGKKALSKLNKEAVKGSQKVVEHVSGQNVQEQKTLNTEGEDTSFFRIVNNNNEPVNDNVYSTRKEAEQARTKIVRTVKKDQAYSFGDMELQRGDTIQNKDGKRFVVMARLNHVEENNNLWVRSNENANSRFKKDQIYIERDDAAEYSKIDEEVLEYQKAASRIPIKEAISINPIWDRSIKNNQQMYDEGNERLQNVLRNLTDVQRKTLTIKLQRGPYWAKREQSFKKLESYQFQDKPINERLKKSRQEFSAEIILDGETIGFFQGPSTMILLDNAGKKIDPLNITEEQAKDLFIIYPRDNIKEKVEEIKDNYAQSIYIYDQFRELLLDQDVVEMPIDQLEGVEVILSEGSLAYAKQRGEEGVTFGELITQFVSEDTTDTLDGQKPYFILDYNRKYPTGGKKAKYLGSKVEGLPITNIKPGSPTHKQLLEQIRLYETKFDPEKRLGKYVAFVTLANGRSAFVHIVPDSIPVEELNEELDIIQERAKLTVKDNVTTKKDGKTLVSKSLSFNNDFNNELAEKIFITAAPGIYIDMAVDNLGRLKITYSDLNTYETIDGKRKTIRRSGAILHEALIKMTDWQEVVDAINTDVIDKDARKVIKDKFRPTLDSFKHSIEKSPDMNVLSLARTKLTAAVKDGFFIKLQAENAREINKIKRASIPEKAYGLDPEVEEVTELSGEERRALALNDYEDMPNDILEVIALKLINKEALTDFEDRVISFDVNENKIKAIRLQIIGNKLPDASTPQEAENQSALDNYTKLNAQLKETKLKFRRENRIRLKEEDSSRSDSDVNILLNDLVAADPTIIALEQAVKEAKGNAYKIIDTFDGNDIEDIETFTQWVRENLPAFIDLKIDDIGERLKANYITVGRFMLQMNKISKDIKDLKGVVNVGAKTPYKYHEAFHGVFRMLLTEEEIKTYLAIAKKEKLALLREQGISLDETLTKMRKQSPLYSDLTREELEERLYEEYMADEFDKFKMNPRSTKTDSFIKSLFNTIIEWIRNVLGQFTTDKSYQLNALFKNIDAAKYRNAGIQINRFTTELVSDPSITESVALKSLILGETTIKRTNKITKKTNTKLVNNFMPADFQHFLISGIANEYLRLRNDKEVTNTKGLLKRTILEFIEIYNPDNKRYTEDRGDEWYDENVTEIIEYYAALLDQVDEITEEVNNRLNAISSRNTEIEDEFAEEEADGRVRDTSQWNKEANTIGGVGSLPTAIREFFSLTNIEERDRFGNLFIDEEKTRPIIVGVDYKKVYDGILKAVANEPDQVKMLQKMWIFSRKNPHTKAVVDRFFREIGIYDAAVSQKGNIPVLFDPDQEIPVPKSKKGDKESLYQLFMSGLKNFRIAYIFEHYDIATSVTHLYAANKKDDAHHTLAEWTDDFNRKYAEIKDLGSEAYTNANNSLTRLGNLLKIKKVSDVKDLSTEIQEVRNELFENIGINISELYLEFSIISGIIEKSDLTEEQVMLLDMYSNKDEITVETVNEIIQSLNRKENLFLNNQVIEGTPEEAEEGADDVTTYETGGVKGRLRSIALNNSAFDESVGATTFIDAEGNRIYAHQQPTYHLVKIAEMKGDRYITDKLDEDMYFENNILLNDPKFQAMVEQGLIETVRIAGSKKGYLSLTEDGTFKADRGLDINKQQGVNYGGSSPREFILNLLHSYLYKYNRQAPNNTEKGYVINSDTGEKEYFAIAPVFIRVIEASNTGDMVTLAVDKMVKKSGEGTVITDEGVDKLETLVRIAYERGQRESDLETWNKNNVIGGNSNDHGIRTDEGRLTELGSAGELITVRKARTDARVQIRLPHVGADARKAIIDGDQSMTLTPAEFAQHSNLSAGQNGLVLIDTMPFIMYNKGMKKFTDLTRDEQTDLIKGLGTSVTRKQTANKKMHSFTIKDSKPYYVYNYDQAEFFRGRQQFSIFSYVPADKVEDVEVGLVTQKVEVKSEASLLKRIDDAMEEENYTLVAVLKDALEAFREKEKVVEEVGPINIYAGTGENANLSNFANRPYTNALGIEFKNVESAFQYAKTNWAEEGMNDEIRIKLQSTTGAQARALGRKIKGLNVKEWDSNSADIMKNIIKESFEQNPKALQELLATGNTELTHTQDKGKWGKEFPRILMEVREELKDSSVEVTTAELVDIELEPVKSLEDAMRKGVPFNEAFEAIGGRELLKMKSMQEVNEFITTLKELRAYDKISKELSDGLGVVERISHNRIVQNVTDEGREIMELYNLREGDLDFNIAQIFLNNQVNATSFNQLLLGDQALTLKDAVHAIKVAKMQNAAGPSAESFISAEALGLMHPTDHISMFLHEDDYFKRKHDVILESDREKETSEGERTDGHVKITTKGMKHILFGVGKLNPAQAAVMKQIIAGDKVAIDKEFFGNSKLQSHKDLDIILNSMKFVYADGQTFIKMSLTTLTKEFTSIQNENGEWVAREGRKPQHNLRVKMEAWEENAEKEGRPDTIAIAVPKSAAKMLKQNMATLDDAYNDRPIDGFNVTDLQAKWMRLQVINPSNKTTSIDPRQIKNIITNEQDPNAIVWINNEEWKIKDVIRMYNKVSGERIKSKWFQRRNIIFTVGDAHNEFLSVQQGGVKMTTNLTAFLKYAIKGLESAQAKTQMLSYFGLDESEEAEYDLNNPITIDQFEILFHAFFNKGVMSEQQPGISAALVSDSGIKVVKQVKQVDENGTPIEWQVIRSNDWETLKRFEPRKFKALQTYTDIENETWSGLKVGDFYMDHLRSNVIDWDENGKDTGLKYTEFMMPPHFKSILQHDFAWDERLPDAIAKMFGIRIPSQDKHSAVNLKLVDFLPVSMGSSAIFARDLIEISGADFDIDKLYMQIKEFMYDNNEFIEYGDVETDEEGFMHYIKYMVKEYGKKDSTLRMAVEDWLRKDRNFVSIIDTVGDTDVYLEMNEEERVQYLKDLRHEDINKRNKKWSLDLFDLAIEDDLYSLRHDDMALSMFENIDGLVEGVESLGLPSTLNGYVEFKEKYDREPYVGPMNNQILDFKYALLGNPGMTEPRDGRQTAIAYEPAVLTPLTDPEAGELMGGGVWEYIQKEFPELAESVREEGVNIDNLLGQLKAWTNNKEGARSIGAVVSPNVIMSIMMEYEKRIRSYKVDGVETVDRLELNEQIYDDFTVNYTINPETGKDDPQLHRKQFVISALITAMTDNAKERLAAKLGLNKNALAITTMMLALGVDIKTTILLINHPTIKEAYYAAINKDTDRGPGVRGILEKRLTNIKDVLEDRAGESTLVSIKTLEEGIKTLDVDKSIEPHFIGIPTEDTNGWTDDELIYDKSVIEQFLIAHKISEFLRNVTTIINLQKTIGKDLEGGREIDLAAEELGLKMTNKEFDESGIPIDVRSIFTGDSMYAVRYEIFREYYDKLAPATFISRTDPFTRMYDIIIDNFDNSPFIVTSERKGKINKDLLSYLTSKAYMKYLTDNSYEADLLGSLQNGMFYNRDSYAEIGDSQMSIVDVLDRITKSLKGQVPPKSNYFIDKFISLVPLTSEDNKSGGDRVETNTWTQISPSDLTIIQNTLLELYSNPETHKDAMHLVHYLLVKDGLQYTSGTFLSAVPATMTKEILNSIGDAHLIFREDKIRKSVYDKVFGVSFEDLINEFTFGYMQATTNNWYLRSFKGTNRIKVYDIEGIDIKERMESLTIKDERNPDLMKKQTSVLVDYDQKESERSTQVLSNLAERPFTYEYGKKTYEFGSVMHAYQVLKSGKFDKRVDNAYKKKGGFGVLIEGKVKKKSGDQAVLLVDLIRESFIQNRALEINGTDITDELMRYVNFTFIKNNKLTQTTKEGLLAAQEEFVYSIQSDGTKNLITRRAVKKQNEVNARISEEPVIENLEKKTLTIDLFKTLPAYYEDRVKLIRRIKGSKNKKKNEENYAIFAKNVDKVESMGFRIITVEVQVGKDKKKRKQVVLPLVIESRSKSKESIFYKLVEVQRDKAYPKGQDPNLMIPSDANVAYGNLGKYVQYEPVGSNQQNGTAFVFDIPGVSERPPYRVIQEGIEARKELFTQPTEGEEATEKAQEDASFTPLEDEEHKKMQKEASSLANPFADPRVTSTATDKFIKIEEKSKEDENLVIDDEDAAEFKEEAEEDNTPKFSANEASKNTEEAKLEDWYDNDEPIKVEGKDMILTTNDRVKLAGKLKIKSSKDLIANYKDSGADTIEEYLEIIKCNI